MMISAMRRPPRISGGVTQMLAVFFEDTAALLGFGAVATTRLIPEDVLLSLEVQFTSGLPAEDIQAAFHRIAERIAGQHP